MLQLDFIDVPNVLVLPVPDKAAQSFPLRTLFFNNSSKNSSWHRKKIDSELMEFKGPLGYFAEGINKQLQSLVVCQSILGLIHHPGNRAQRAMLDPLCVNANLILLKKCIREDIAGGVCGGKVCVCVHDCVQGCVDLLQSAHVRVRHVHIFNT